MQSWEFSAAVWIDSLRVRIATRFDAAEILWTTNQNWTSWTRCWVYPNRNIAGEPHTMTVISSVYRSMEVEESRLQHTAPGQGS